MINILKNEKQENKTISKITGLVVHGRKEGRKIGFPTANIKIEEGFNSQNSLKNIPLGIYASKIKIKDIWYICATSYGTAPTYNFWEITLESHILDFDMDIYGQIVELKLTKYIRPIVKFENLPTLIDQIKIDCQSVRNVFKVTN